MNKKSVVSTICLIVISLLFSATLFAAEADVITITGLVVGLYDDANKIEEVYIEVINSKYYEVSPEGKGKELMALVDENVEVSGIIVKDENDEDDYKTLIVQSFKILAE